MNTVQTVDVVTSLCEGQHRNDSLWCRYHTLSSMTVFDVVFLVVVAAGLVQVIFRVFDKCVCCCVHRRRSTPPPSSAPADDDCEAKVASVFLEADTYVDPPTYREATAHPS